MTCGHYRKATFNSRNLQEVSCVVMVRVKSLSRRLVQPTTSSRTIVFSKRGFRYTINARISRNIHLGSLASPMVGNLVFPKELPIPVIVSSQVPTFSLQITGKLRSRGGVSRASPPSKVFFSLGLPNSPSFPFLTPLKRITISTYSGRFLGLFKETSLYVVTNLFRPLGRSKYQNGNVRGYSSRRVTLPQKVVVGSRHRPLLFPFFLSGFRRPRGTHRGNVSPLHCQFRL